MNNSFQLIRTKYVNKQTEKWTKTRNNQFTEKRQWLKLYKKTVSSPSKQKWQIKTTVLYSVSDWQTQINIKGCVLCENTVTSVHSFWNEDWYSYFGEYFNKA